jgi:hypothetical protein
MQIQRWELEASLTRTRNALQEGKQRWRRLHHERQTLKHRINAPEQSIVLCTPEPVASRSPLQLTCFDESAFQSDPIGHVRADIEVPVLPMRGSALNKQSQSMLQHQMVQGKRHSRYGKQHCATPSTEPISDFQHHAVTSFSALSKYMTSQEFRTPSQLNHRELRQAFLMCQSETAQRLNMPSSKICWFLMWPCGACGKQQLVTSFSARSGACKLTSLMAEMSLVVECMFLVLEHEHLSSAADPLFKPPKHPVLETTATPLPQRPESPDAALLASTSVFCSVTDRVQVGVAVRRIIEPMVRHFRSLLPLSMWLSVCIQVIRMAESSGQVLRAILRQHPESSQMNAMEAKTNQDAQCCSEV